MAAELEKHRSSVIAVARAVAEEDRKRRGLKSAMIVERVLREQLRAMGCERFDLGIRRDTGEMILREATVSNVKL
jgi:hypothetical protein